jgi:dihydroxyacetone kinase-like protein
MAPGAAAWRARWWWRKLVGAAAEAGASLEQCKALGDRVNSRTASMGVAFTSCTVPAAGRATFDIAEDEMEFGVGIHGEPGRRRGPVQPAAELVQELMDAILGDLKPRAGTPAAAARQRLRRHAADGAVPAAPLRRTAARAARPDVTRSLVGNYTTSLEMAGASLTVTCWTRS